VCNGVGQIIRHNPDGTAELIAENFSQRPISLANEIKYHCACTRNWCSRTRQTSADIIVLAVTSTIKPRHLLGAGKISFAGDRLRARQP
jgi:hypothetical protein